MAELEAETAKLREALHATPSSSDPGLPREVAPPTAAPVTDTAPANVEAPAPEITEEQRREVDSLLSRYRLEKTRGNRDFAEKYLQEACEKGLLISSVQEVLGDELAERRKYNDAMAAYKRAVELDPKNVSADKKHADLVFSVKAKSMSVAATEFESVASSRSAQIISMIVPGGGHVILGQWVKGAAFFIGWIGSIAWVVATPNGISGLTGLVRGGSDFNPLVLGGVLLGFIVWISALVDAGSGAKVAERRRLENLKAPIKPPVDLPFE